MPKTNSLLKVMLCICESPLFSAYWGYCGQSIMLCSIKHKENIFTLKCRI